MSAKDKQRLDWLQRHLRSTAKRQTRRRRKERGRDEQHPRQSIPGALYAVRAQVQNEVLPSMLL